MQRGAASTRGRRSSGIAVALSALGSLLLTVALGAPVEAEASTKVVRDAKRETAPLRKNGRLDITRAIAGHKGGLLSHTVVVRRKVDPSRGRERPVIALNTRGGRRSDPEYQVFGDAVYKTTGGTPRQVADAELRHRGRSWTYLFDPAALELRRYGWAAITTKGNAYDVTPPRRYSDHRA